MSEGSAALSLLTFTNVDIGNSANLIVLYRGASSIEKRIILKVVEGHEHWTVKNGTNVKVAGENREKNE